MQGSSLISMLSLLSGLEICAGVGWLWLEGRMKLSRDETRIDKVGVVQKLPSAPAYERVQESNMISRER